jgi:hypothetical protein
MAEEEEAELVQLAAVEQATLDHALQYGLVHPYHRPPATPADAERVLPVGHAALGRHHLRGITHRRGVVIAGSVTREHVRDHRVTDHWAAKRCPGQDTLPLQHGLSGRRPSGPAFRPPRTAVLSAAGEHCDRRHRLDSPEVLPFPEWRRDLLEVAHVVQHRFGLVHLDFKRFEHAVSDLKFGMDTDTNYYKALLLKIGLRLTLPSLGPDPGPGSLHTAAPREARLDTACLRLSPALIVQLEHRPRGPPFGR